MAFVIRALLCQTARFSGDEIRFYQTAVNISQGIEFPLLGTPLTAGLARHPGPAFYYLMSIPLLIVKTPEACNVMVAFLGAITVLIFFLGIRRLVSFRSAFLSSLLMACSPWSILYADRIWNSNIIVLFVTIAMYATIRLREKYSTKYFLILVASCIVMPQFHMSVPIVWISILYLIRRELIQIKLNDILYSLIIILLINLPFIYHELTTGFLNTKNFLSDGKKEGKSTRAILGVWSNLFRFITLETIYHEFSGYWGAIKEKVYIASWYSDSPVREFSIVRTVARLIGVLTPLYFIFNYFKSQKALKSDWFVSLILGAISAVLLLAVTGKKMYPHYVHPLFPFIFLIFPWAFDKVKITRNTKVLYSFIIVFCISGIESSLRISFKKDIDNSIYIHRKLAQQFQQMNLKSYGVKSNYIFFPEGTELIAKEQYNYKLTYNKENDEFLLVNNRNKIEVFQGYKLITSLTPTVSLYQKSNFD